MVFNPHYWLTIPLISIAVFPGAALAQLTPDASLGSESTLVTPDVLVQGTPADLVEGGAIRGENLFHSFSDFNVETLQRIYFANPAGIETILTRITGGNASNIDGLLGVDGLADLYLLNPNGIAFGPNAQLDIRGSFFVSTAEGWELDNGEMFSALNPEAPPILAVTLTPGLQYGATQQADVGNAGNLAVAPRESLVLLGDTVTSTGTLTAPVGQVQLLGNRVGLLDEGRIDVSAPTGGGTINLGGDFQGQGILPTSAQTVVGPNAVLIADATETGTGGNIIVWSDGITRFGGLAQANGGTIGGDGGFIEISGADSLVFDGVVSTAAPRGNRGTVLFDPTNIVVVEDALAETTDLSTVDDPFDPDIGGDGDTRLAASALANAVANSNVSLQATNDIRFEAALNIANPGVTLTAIAGNDIQVSNNILFPAGGDVIFEAGNTVEFAGTDAVLETRGGDISIATNQLLMANDAQISASTFGIGDGGVIEINATDRIQLDSSDIYSSASAGDG
ncbi:MAG: filamentous hemagglutinin N-terminal domain-containing protein, partial [Cyanobacteria bacterium P01_C01_bin.147]